MILQFLCSCWRRSLISRRSWNRRVAVCEVLWCFELFSSLLRAQIFHVFEISFEDAVRQWNLPRFCEITERVDNCNRATRISDCLLDPEWLSRTWLVFKRLFFRFSQLFCFLSDCIQEDKRLAGLRNHDQKLGVESEYVCEHLKWLKWAERACDCYPFWTNTEFVNVVRENGGIRLQTNPVNHPLLKRLFDYCEAHRHSYSLVETLTEERRCSEQIFVKLDASYKRIMYKKTKREILPRVKIGLKDICWRRNGFSLVCFLLVTVCSCSSSWQVLFIWS